MVLPLLWFGLLGACGNGSVAERMEGYVVQPVDHHAFGRNPHVESSSFRMRVLYDTTHYEGAVSPVIFYAGNEGDIGEFWNNAGFLREEMARELKAAVVFAEHRYFGTSLPFGETSFDNPGHRQYLTVDQALLDYAKLVEEMKYGVDSGLLTGRQAINNFFDRPRELKRPIMQRPIMHIPNIQPLNVIAVGGSYGGMLAAWMRMKYPQLIVGALAASAPLRGYKGAVDQFAYFDNISNTLASYAAAHESKCTDIIRDTLETFAYTKEVIEPDVRMGFNLCSQKTEGQSLLPDVLQYYKDAISSIAMANYPYSANFLGSLVANPLRALCQGIEEGIRPVGSIKPALRRSLALRNGLDAAGYTIKGQCLDLNKHSDLEGSQGWDYLACTSLVLVTSTGEQSIFPVSRFRSKTFTNDCHNKYGVRPDFGWIDRFEGRELEQCKNIIFSNGSLDPWYTAGILSSPTNSCPTFRLEGAAHHLDLRSPNPADPPLVTQARKKYIEIVSSWIKANSIARSIEPAYVEM